MPGVTIRPAGPADVEAYALLAREFEAYLTAIDPAGEGPPRADHAAAFLRDACGDQPWFHCLVAEDGSDSLGFLSYHFGYYPEQEAGTLFITDLFVRQATRGRGVGKALMAEAATILNARGGGLVMWSVWDINHPAMRFYESLGAAYMDEERLMSLPVSHWLG